MSFRRRCRLWALRTFFLCDHTFSDYVNWHWIYHDFWIISLGVWKSELFLHCLRWPATDQLGRLNHLHSFLGRSFHIFSQSQQKVLYSLSLHHLFNLFFLLLFSLYLCLYLAGSFLLAASCSLGNIGIVERVTDVSKRLIHYLLILLCREGRIRVVSIELELELFWLALMFFSAADAFQKPFGCVVHALPAGLTESMQNYRNVISSYSRCFFRFDLISKWDFPPRNSSSYPGSGLMSSTGKWLSVFPLYLERIAEKRISS